MVMMQAIFILTLLTGFHRHIQAKPSVVCSSPGLCLKTSGKCVPDSIVQCFRETSHVLDRYFSYTPSGEEIASGNCQTFQDHANVKLQNLTVRYIAVNPNYVSICVSWSVQAGVLSEGGYKVQFDRAYLRPIIHCIEDFNHTSVCLNNVEYRSLKYYPAEVKVRPLTLPMNADEEEWSLSQPLRTDIRGCMDVQNDNIVCIPRYGKPRDLSVTSRICQDGSKTLRVSWNHFSGVPIPEAYFSQLLDARRRSLDANFKVVNASEVVLSGLDMNAEYHVRVQAYHTCSGLGKYDYYYLGCGRGRTKKEERQDDSSTLMASEGSGALDVYC